MRPRRCAPPWAVCSVCRLWWWRILRGQILSLRDQGVQVYAAALHRDSVPITELNFQQPSAVVIGNEGNGLTEEIIAACTKPMVIPMAGRAESLNAAVAATVAIWEMCKGQ